MAETNGTTAPPAQDRRLRATLRAFVSRLGLANSLGTLFGGKQKVAEVLGYKDKITYQDFKLRYLRQDIAHTIVSAYPNACWSQPPVVQEEDETDKETPFETAWEGLVTRLHLYDVMARADLLANLGQYSTVLLGLRNQGNLELEAAPVRSPDDLLYVIPYSEEFMEVWTFDEDPGSETFAQPLLYHLRTGKAREGSTNRYPRAQTLTVHASRLIHIAEDVLDDEVYAVPRLEPVYNLLDDMLMVVGGSAHMFWTDAKRRIALEVQDGYQLGDEDKAALTQEVEEYEYGMRNFLRLMGVTAKDLSGVVASPKEHFEVLIALLAATLRMPQRILLGSERGNLASGQDEGGWLQQVSTRRLKVAEARIVRPLIDRLLLLGALPEPAQPYTVVWDDLFSLSEEQRAAVTKTWTEAIVAYTGPGLASTLVTPEEYRVDYLGKAEVPELGELVEEMEPVDEGVIPADEPANEDEAV